VKIRDAARAGPQIGDAAKAAAVSDPDRFRNRISFAADTMPEREVEYWAAKFDADPQVVRDAYAEIRRGMQNPPEPALAEVVAIEKAPRRGMRR
jgi:hypothetical protein